MKLAKPVTLLTVGLMALSLGVTGCKKKPTNLTTIPGNGPGTITDEGTKPIGNVNPIPNGNGIPGGGPVTPVPITNKGNETGLPAAKGEWDKWFANPNEFKDQTVFFDFDKANVRPSEVGKLKEVAHRMKGFPGKALRIEGHCDERGTEEYNRTLGDRRAQSIREFLAKEGFDAEMMPTITYGEDKPADPGHNEEAFKKNRRGELILLSPTP